MRRTCNEQQPPIAPVKPHVLYELPLPTLSSSPTGAPWPSRHPLPAHQKQGQLLSSICIHVFPCREGCSHMGCTSGYWAPPAPPQNPILPQAVLTHTPGEVRPMLCLVGAEDGQAPVLLHLPTAENRGCWGGGQGGKRHLSATWPCQGPTQRTHCILLAPSSSCEEASSHCLTTRRPSSAITQGYLQGEHRGGRSGPVLFTPHP